MKRIVWLLIPAMAGLFLMGCPTAHADYYNYPCNYPAVGTSGDVDVIVHGGGQYCDYPTEINGSHYHCESGGGGIGGGALALAPIGPINLGGFGGSGIGGNFGRCAWRCPDNTNALPPNPPAAWVKHLVIDDRHNDCRDHMTPAGADSAPQAPGSGPPAPGQPDIPSGQLPEGTPPPPPPVAPAPGTPPIVTVPDDPSLLTPGSPLQLP